MELFDRVEALAARSRHAETPNVDVVGQVCRTIRLQRAEDPVLLDTPSVAFAGLSLAVTGIAAVWFLPLLTALWDPWVAYMNAPWSI